MYTSNFAYTNFSNISDSSKELIRTTPEEWDNLVTQCVEPNIYQGSQWGTFKSHQAWKVYRFLYKQHDSHAMAQCFTRNIPMLPVRFTWVHGGPIFTANGINLVPGLLKGIKNYFGSRTHILRINPMIRYNSNVVDVLSEAGYAKPSHPFQSSQTVCIGTAPNIDLHDTMGKNWKRNLKRSERHNCSVTLNNTDKAFNDLYNLCAETQTLKNLNKQSFEEMSSLRECFKDSFIIVVVYQDSTPIAARALVHFGKIAYDMLAGTSMLGRKLYASYAALFELMVWCQNNNLIHYDLSGINRVTSPGVYNYKIGTGGQVISFIGEMESTDNKLLSIIWTTVSKYLR